MSTSDSTDSEEVLQFSDQELSEDHGQLTAEVNEYLKSIGLSSSVLEDTGDRSLERTHVNEAKGAQKEGRVDMARQWKSKADNQLQRTDSIDPVATGAVAVSSEGRKKIAKKSQGPSVAGEHSDVVPRLLSYQANQQKRLLFNYETAGPWFEEVGGEVARATTPYPCDVIDHLTKVAAELLSRDVQVYETAKEQKKRSDVEWLRTVMTSGTLADKMAARALLIQESLVHNLASLDSLLSMSNKKGKRESLQAIDVLKDLWLSTLLPRDRKLRAFASRPLHQLVGVSSSQLKRDRQLLLWHVEEQVKSCYQSYVATLQSLLRDPVVDVRSKLLGHVFDLLTQCPEQEQSLLSMLVNKLGDPNGKIASRTSLFLLKLVTQHPNMSRVVVREVERLLYRPNISDRAQYYAICFLNQLPLKKGADDLAGHLVGLYFVFFKTLVQNDQLNTKMLSAVLTGVNRAFPFTRGEVDSFEDHMDTLFKVVHVGPVATGIQALMLLYQVMESRQSVSDRYYRALYSKLLDPQLCSTSKLAIFLNVLYKSLKSDPELNRVKGFLKRIFQVCGHHSPPFICGCLLLVSEIVKEKPALWSFILSPEAEDEEEHFEDAPEDGEEAGQGSEERKTEEDGGRSYRGLHRNPLYCRAESSCLWELERLVNHFHPSVQVMAATVAKGDYITYPSDPLQDFTLARFLDRFVYKNPKQKESDHGGSVMQRFKRSLVASQLPANSTDFARLREEDVREDEKYLHKFFQQKKPKKSKEDAFEDKLADNESGNDSLEEMDFASEFDRKKLAKLKKGKNTDAEDDLSSDEGEGEEEDSGEEYDLDDLDFDQEYEDDSNEEGVVPGGRGEPSEAEYERVLLDNLSLTDSEGEGEEEEAPRAKRRKSGGKQSVEDFDPSAVFASVEEFSHLLEEGQGGRAGGRKGQNSKASERQLKWEDSREVGRRKGSRHRQPDRSGASKKGSSGRQKNGKGFHRKKLGRTKRK